MGTSIPVLTAKGKGLAETWENSVVKLYALGMRIRTEYDPPGGEESVDATMLMTAEEPEAEPQIHKAMPAGPGDLQEYTMEVVDGIKDHWVDLEDPTKWKYTYHERLTAYPGGEHGVGLDQIELMVRKLAKAPHTRRAYAATSVPGTDWEIGDPPCCLGVWCRIFEGALQMNVTFRSRDAFDAAFMNMFAFVELQKSIARRVSEYAGVDVRIGRYCDMSYSYHIYGRRLEAFRETVMRSLQTRSFYSKDPANSRTATLEDWGEMMVEAIPGIRKKVDEK